MPEILHEFGNYSIRYYPTQDAKGGYNKFVIPEVNEENSLHQLIRVIHGDRAFTRRIWADICSSLKNGVRKYNGIVLAKAALIYGGELKCPGRAMQSNGSWFERSEKNFIYETVDGGSVIEHFSGGGDIIKEWDPEPQPEPVVTTPEPEAPPQIMGSLSIPSEAEMDQELLLKEITVKLPEGMTEEEFEALLTQPSKAIFVHNNDMDTLIYENEQLKAELAALKELPGDKTKAKVQTFKGNQLENEKIERMKAAKKPKKEIVK
jgi:hypothetical protein